MQVARLPKRCEAEIGHHRYGIKPRKQRHQVRFAFRLDSESRCNYAFSIFKIVQDGTQFNIRNECRKLLIGCSQLFTCFLVCMVSPTDDLCGMAMSAGGRAGHMSPSLGTGEVAGWYVDESCIL